MKKQRQLSEFKARQIFSQVIEAVLYTHNQNILHRSISPINIKLVGLVGEEIKLGGFGNATYIKEGEKLAKIVGQPGYIAPEILNNKGYDKRADVFSCGCLLFFLLFNEKLFKGVRQRDIHQKNAKCDL